MRNWNNLPEGRTAGPPPPTPIPRKIGLKGPAWHLNKPPSVKAVCLLSVGRPLPHLCTVKRPLLISGDPGEAPAASALGPLLYNHPSVPLVGEEVPLSPRPPSPHPSTQPLCGYLQDLFRLPPLIVVNEYVLSAVGTVHRPCYHRKTSISALLTMPKPLTVWITINCAKF